MKTIDDALAFADTFDKPANKYMGIVMLAAEARRLREENERLKSNPPQSLSSIPPDCRTCTNRGHINGLSQETYCDGCMWYGAYWKRNHYSPIQEPTP